MNIEISAHHKIKDGQRIAINSSPFTKEQSKRRQNLIANKPLNHKVEIGVNKWTIMEDKNTSYVISTSGCGAIKIFVESNARNCEIGFHSFGTEDSMITAKNIGQFINNIQDKSSVRILCLQPYGFSLSINKTIEELQHSINNVANIPLTITSVKLDKIPGEERAKFIEIDLKGSQEDILKRYEHLRYKTPSLTKTQRNQKIDLFIQIPVNYRTREFINKWGSLTLEEAKEEFEKLNLSKKKCSNNPVSFILKCLYKNIFHV